MKFVKRHVDRTYSHVLINRNNIGASVLVPPGSKKGIDHIQKNHIQGLLNNNQVWCFSPTDIQDILSQYF